MLLMGFTNFYCQASKQGQNSLDDSYVFNFSLKYMYQVTVTMTSAVNQSRTGNLASFIV